MMIMIMTMKRGTLDGEIPDFTVCSLSRGLIPTHTVTWAGVQHEEDKEARQPRSAKGPLTCGIKVAMLLVKRAH